MRRLLLFCAVALVQGAAAPLAVAQPAATCELGTFVQSLGDFDVTEGTFAARAWVWSRCPRENVAVLPRLDFVNAEAIELRFADSLRSPLPLPRGAAAGTVPDTLYYGYVQARGLFRHEWDVRNYPFDRHTLRLDVEHTLLDTTDVRLMPDAVESGLSPEMRLNGWRVTGVRFLAKPVTYETTFGDPNAADRATFSRVTAEIDVARDSLLSFFKLTAGLYIAVAVALVTFWLRSSDGSATGARMSLLVGALFAAFVNLSSATGVVGRTEQLTLIDTLHFLGMALILVAVVVTAADDRLDVKTAARRDRWTFVLSGGFFLLANAVLIAMARAAG